MRWRCAPSGRLLVSEDDPALGEIVGTHGHGDLVTKHDTNAVAAKLTRQVSLHFAACFGFHEEGSTWKYLHHFTFNLNQVVTSHVHLGALRARVTYCAQGGITRMSIEG